MSGRDEIQADERHRAFPFAFDEADSAGDAPESVPLDGSILWLPWKNWITGQGPKDETAVVFLQSVLEELRVRFASGGAGAAGLLAGHFLRCPRTGRDWVRVERALPSLYLLEEAARVEELERALGPLHDRLSSDEAVVGWYRGRRSALPALTPEDLDFHARRMRPGRSPVVVEASEATRPLAGVYVPGGEGPCPPEAYHPFLELLPLDAVGADGTRFSRMHWTNYESEGRVVRPGTPEQSERPTGPSAFVPSWQAVLQEALGEQEAESAVMEESLAVEERAVEERSPVAGSRSAEEDGPLADVGSVEETAVAEQGAVEGVEVTEAATGRESPIPSDAPTPGDAPTPVGASTSHEDGDRAAERSPERAEPVRVEDRRAARRAARRRRRVAAVGGTLAAAAALAIAVALGPWSPWTAAGGEGRESGAAAARAAAAGASGVEAAAAEAAPAERPGSDQELPEIRVEEAEERPEVGTADAQAGRAATPGSSFERAADLYERRRAAFASGAIGCAELAAAYRAADEAFLALAVSRSRGTSATGSGRFAAYDAAVPRMAGVDAHFDGSGCPRP